MDNIQIVQRRITKQEYIDFLKRSDLGSQYPRERFEQRIQKLVNNTSISLIAKDGDKIVGVFFGITDFAYWLFVTDIGVDREYTHRGIGTRLMQEAFDIAGGTDDINVYLCADEDSIAFYEKIGMKRSTDVMEFAHAQWTKFTVE